MGDPSSNSTDSISSSESKKCDQTNLIMLKPDKEPPRSDPACFGSGVPKPESTGSTLRSTATTSGVPPQWTSSSTRDPTQQLHLVHKDYQQTSTTSVNSLSSLPSVAKTENHKSPITSVAVRLCSPKQNTFKMSINAKTPSNNVSQPAKKKKKRSDNNSSNASAGRWTEQEHHAFLTGLATYGREWKKVAEHIPTRTSAQVRSHAQKYFAKIQKEQELMTNVVFSNNGSAAHAIPDQLEQDDHSEVQQLQLSASVQANVARILAEPQTVQREVEETLQRLRARYRELQRRLRARERGGVADENSSRASLESLQNEELIALHVLQGGLPHRDNSSSAGENQNEEEDGLENDDDDDQELQTKRRRLE